MQVKEKYNVDIVLFRFTMLRDTSEKLFNRNIYLELEIFLCYAEALRQSPDLFIIGWEGPRRSYLETG